VKGISEWLKEIGKDLKEHAATIIKAIIAIALDCGFLIVYIYTNDFIQKLVESHDIQGWDKTLISVIKVSVVVSVVLLINVYLIKDLAIITIRIFKEVRDEWRGPSRQKSDENNNKKVIRIAGILSQYQMGCRFAS
jgi:hypothetical protein